MFARPLCVITYGSHRHLIWFSSFAFPVHKKLKFFENQINSIAVSIAPLFIANSVG